MPKPHGWEILGGTGIPDDDPREPWPGEVRYTLAEVADSTNGIDLIAFYKVADP